MSIRPVKRIVQSKPTLEGAGVRLRRAFGFGNTAEFDPFLLLDDFRNNDPADYLAGFPWHPHRGIETITYVLAGTVDHGDSLGNQGSLGAGDVQWMTAGSGILHQEMPKGDPQGRMHGFQLWANLPSSLKMTKPRYQDVKAVDIPEIIDDDGTRVRVVCGSFWGRSGPVDGVAADPRYLDIFVPPGVRKHLPVETVRNAFAYVFDGSGSFRDAAAPRPVQTDRVGPVVADAPDGRLQPASAKASAVRRDGPRSGPSNQHWLSGRSATRPGEGGKDAPHVENRTLVVFDRGDEVVVEAGERGIRFLLVSGQPIEEPVAWYGPIVMNTEDELRQAYAELRAGTFIRG